MKYLKIFEDFNDFDFLANVGKMEKAILKVVEIHEKHYYNDTKISSDPEFLRSIKDLIDTSVSGEEIFSGDYLSVVSSFEESHYNKDLFLLNAPDVQYDSLDGIIQDLVIPLLNVSRKGKSEEYVSQLGVVADEILNKIDDSWVFRDFVEADPNKKTLGDLPKFNLN